MVGIKIISGVFFVIILYLSSYALWRFWRANIVCSHMVVLADNKSPSISTAPVPQFEFVLFYPSIYAEVVWYRKQYSGLIRNGI